MNLFLEIFIGFTILGLTEAVWKPLATAITRRKILQFAPEILRKFDSFFIEDFKEKSASELRDIMINLIKEQTGEDWTEWRRDLAVKTIVNEFDPFVFAETAKRNRGGSKRPQQ